MLYIMPDCVSTLEGAPIFIVGAERSGTTLFRLMLDQHPQLAVCSEFEYAVDPLVGSRGWPDVDLFRRSLQANWIFRDHGFAIDPSLDFPSLVRSFLHQTARRAQAAQVIAVVHRNFDQISRVWPHARYIHIVRDPRDVARSVVGMGWAGNVWHGAERWINVERMWDRMRKQLCGRHMLEVRMESPVSEPELELRHVCDFLRVPYDSRMLDYHLHSTYDPPDSTMIEQWRRNMSHRDIALVEARLGNLLQQRGYEPAVIQPPTPSSWDRIRLKLHDKLERTKYRANVYGWDLFIAEFISRKMHLRTWHAQLEPQLHALWKSRLK